MKKVPWLGYACRLLLVAIEGSPNTNLEPKFNYIRERNWNKVFWPSQAQATKHNSCILRDQRNNSISSFGMQN
jgi:hypothetical protein